MAVNLVNSLPRDRFSVYLCTTRSEGSLASLVADDVRRLCLGRNRRYDLIALSQLIAFDQRNKIEILHAHDASLFLAVLASFFPPFPRIVWHDHFGLHETEERSVWLYGLATRRVRGVIAVNESLALWSSQSLRVPKNRVWYIPNFVSFNGHPKYAVPLPGSSGSRVVCLANLRAQKDHLTLLRAMQLVVREVPAAHLILVGDDTEPEYGQLVRDAILRQRLERNVSLLGPRQDVDSILQGCDIGVLSSTSEGLPLALIEYGMAGLPVVATNVGQCGEVLEQGRGGMLVPPGCPEKLATALILLLKTHERRVALGKQLQHRVRECYSPEAVMDRICEVYAKAHTPIF